MRSRVALEGSSGMFRAYRGVGKDMRGNGLVWGKKEEDAGQVWGVEAFEHDISPSIEVQELVHISGDLFHSITEITLETGFGMLATQDQSGGPRFSCHLVLVRSIRSCCSDDADHSPVTLI